MRRKFLLDTQVFIFSAQDEPRLSPKAHAALLHPESDIYLSLASLWEMQIKIGVKKLKLLAPLPVTVQRAVTDLSLEILPLQLEHIYRLANLPFHHKDPFDRLLIAQALHEQMTILGNDRVFDAYGVDRLW